MKMVEFISTQPEYEKYMRIRPCVSLHCDLHIHDYCEFIVLWEGDAVCHLGSQTRQITAGQCVFVPMMVPHKYENAAPLDAAVVFVQHSHLAFSRLHVQNIPLEHAVFTLSPPVLAYLKENIRDLDTVTYDNEKIFTDMPVFLLLSEMCKRLPPGTETAGQPLRGAYNPLLNQVLTYVINNHTDKLTLHGVAKRFGLSDEYLCRLISRGLPKECNTFTKFLSGIRVKHAAELLTETDMRIGEIADTVGCGTLRNFNKLFRERTGCSPSEYRGNR